MKQPTVDKSLIAKDWEIPKGWHEYNKAREAIDKKFEPKFIALHIKFNKELKYIPEHDVLSFRGHKFTSILFLQHGLKRKDFPLKTKKMIGFIYDNKKIFQAIISELNQLNDKVDVEKSKIKIEDYQ